MEQFNNYVVFVAEVIQLYHIIWLQTFSFPKLPVTENIYMSIKEKKEEFKIKSYFPFPCLIIFLCRYKICLQEKYYNFS